MYIILGLAARNVGIEHLKLAILLYWKILNSQTCLEYVSVMQD